MNATRRSFLKALAGIPILGPLLAGDLELEELPPERLMVGGDVITATFELRDDRCEDCGAFLLEHGQGPWICPRCSMRGSGSPLEEFAAFMESEGSWPDHRSIIGRSSTSRSATSTRSSALRRNGRSWVDPLPAEDPLPVPVSVERHRRAAAGQAER